MACSSCQKKLSYIKGPCCFQCGRPLAHEEAYCASCGRWEHSFDRNRSVWQYSMPMKQSLYRFKYQNKREYADFYGREALRMYGFWIEQIRAEAVVPVPLHPSRRRERGYNQAACFGKVIAEGLGLPLRQDLVYRTKKTLPQKALGAGERSRNLAGAFAPGKKGCPYKRVLVVDDIFTTGGTLDAVASVLKKAGAEKVWGLTISMGAASGEE